MKKIIQLRGTNATGKTTAVRNFINLNNNCIYKIPVRGKEYEYTFLPDRNIVVAGRYDLRECGGIDGIITNKYILKEYMYKIMVDLKPEAVILDAVMYGVSFQFGYELSKVGEQLGYHYIGVLCAPPLDVSLLRLYKRNGGKEINVDHLQQKYFQSLKAYRRSCSAGMDMKLIDTSKIPKDKMQKIIEDCL